MCYSGMIEFYREMNEYKKLKILCERKKKFFKINKFWCVVIWSIGSCYVKWRLLWCVLSLICI